MHGAVVDASTMVAALLDDGREGLVAQAAIRDRTLFAPTLLHFEVMQSFRGLERAGIPTLRVEVALRALRLLPVELHGVQPIADRMWELRQNLTAYDAAYVALAERLDLPLITCDRKMTRAPGLRCEVIVPA